MPNPKGFIGLGALLAIVLGLIVIGGGAYYVMHQNSGSQAQNLPEISTTQQTQTQAATKPTPPPSQTTTGVVQKTNSVTTSNVPPVISSISPSDAAVGAQVVINGHGFTPTNNYVRIGIWWIGPLNSNDGTTLIFSVPAVASVCDPLESTCNASPQNLTVDSYHGAVLSVWNTNGEDTSGSFGITSGENPYVDRSEPSADVEQVTSSVQAAAKQSPPSLTTTSLTPTLSGLAIGTNEIKIVISTTPGYSKTVYRVTIPVTGQKWSATIPSGLVHNQTYTIDIDDTSGQGPLWESQLVVQ